MSLLLLLHSGQALTQSITDDTGCTDSASTVSAFAVGIVDGATGTDSSTSVSAHFLTVTDNAGASDGLGFSTPTDLLSLTDSVSFGIGRVFADSVGSSDSANNSAGRSGAANDVAALSDSQITFVKNVNLAVLDLVGPTDAVALTFSVTFADNAGLSDPFQQPHLYNQVAGPDDAGLTDIFGYTLNAVRAITITDDAGASDAVQPSGAHFLVLTDLAGAADSANSGVGHNFAVADDAGLEDVVTTQYTPPGSWTEGSSDDGGLTDAVMTQSDHSLSIADSMAASDSTAQLYLKTWTIDIVDALSSSDVESSSTDFEVAVSDDVGLDTAVTRSQNRVNSGRTIQMVEYITRMED